MADRQILAVGHIDTVGALVVKPGAVDELHALFVEPALLWDGEQEVLVRLAFRHLPLHPSVSFLPLFRTSKALPLRNPAWLAG